MDFANGEILIQSLRLPVRRDQISPSRTHATVRVGSVGINGGAAALHFSTAWGQRG